MEAHLMHYDRNLSTVSVKMILSLKA